MSRLEFEWMTVIELPVNDFVLVQILKAENDASGVKDSTWLRENVGVNVHHQIASGRVFHHETNMCLCHSKSRSESKKKMN